MSPLNQETTSKFLERFYSFNDAVLRKLEISYTEEGERTVTVWVAARDVKKSTNNGWVCVRLFIGQAQEFCFADSANTSAAVLSNGIHICWTNETVGLDFSHFVDPPGDLEELKSSKFFVTGLTVDWAVEPC